MTPVTENSGSRNEAAGSLRIISALVIATLFSSMLAGSVAWYASILDGQSLADRLVAWTGTWASYSIWALLVSIPGVLLGSLLDRNLPRSRSPLGRTSFILLGLLVGAAGALLILKGIAPILLAAAIIGLIGAITAYITRQLVDPLSRSHVVLGLLTALTVCLTFSGLFIR